MHKDGLVEFSNEGIILTEIGKDFTQNIMNVFDKYDPPNKSYKERLDTIKKAKRLKQQFKKNPIKNKINQNEL